MRFASDSKGNMYRIEEDGQMVKVEDERVLPCPEAVLPPAGTMAKSLVASALTWARTGFKLVDEAEQRRRWHLCQLCERLIGQERCAECGCFMKVKTKLAAMRCPIGLW